MKIGILGAGNIGSRLARHLTREGHAVWIANSRGPDSLRELAAETGAVPVTISEVVKNKDVVIVTIPLRHVPDLPKELLLGVSEDTVFIDTCNYFPGRNGRIDLIENGMPQSRWVERHLGRPVIKTFNSIAAAHLDSLAKPAGHDRRVALPISGDNPLHKTKVMELVNAVGFDPVDAGGLDESWRQQPGMPCFTADLEQDALRDALASAISPTT